jgi:hypothetical protein
LLQLFLVKEEEPENSSSIPDALLLSQVLLETIENSAVSMDIPNAPLKIPIFLVIFVKGE